jgi:hypothetical protein
MSHLKKIDLYDRSLIVVTADHGASFKPGDFFRTVSSTNYPDIIHVPLFMKLPGKSSIAIIDKNVESIDILPTIAEALDIELKFQTDGKSALQEWQSPRVNKRVHKSVFALKKEWQEYGSDLNKMYASVDIKINLFATGSTEKILAATRMNLNQNVSSQTDSSISIELKNEKSFQNVDLKSGFIPSLISGRVLFRKRSAEPVLLGVWVNGAFQGVTRTFPPEENVSGWLRTLWLRPTSNKTQNASNIEDIQGFGIMVPESSFKQGKNEVQIAVVPENVVTSAKTN